MRWLLAITLLASGCMLETSRYRRAAERSSAIAKREVVDRFEAEHALTQVHRRPRSHSRQFKAVARWQFGEQLGQVGGQLVFEQRASWPADEQCWTVARLPSYRFYQATDGHYVVLRLIPDIEFRPTRTAASILSKLVPPPLTSPGPCGFEHARFESVVLGVGDPSTVELIDAHYMRWVVALE